MAAKVKTLTVRPEHEFGTLKGFRVVKVTDTIEYLPGAFVSTSDVEQLCTYKDWKVTIVGYSS